MAIINPNSTLGTAKITRLTCGCCFEPRFSGPQRPSVSSEVLKALLQSGETVFRLDVLPVDEDFILTPKRRWTALACASEAPRAPHPETVETER